MTPLKNWANVNMIGAILAFSLGAGLGILSINARADWSKAKQRERGRGNPTFIASSIGCACRNS